MPQDLLTKEGRKACWEAKDSYWTCIDDHLGDQSKCLKQRELFEKDCSKAWVS